jgi:hypothetical protein
MSEDKQGRMIKLRFTPELQAMAERLADKAVEAAERNDIPVELIIVIDSGDGVSGSVADRTCDLCSKVDDELLNVFGPLELVERKSKRTVLVGIGLCDDCTAANVMDADFLGPSDASGA